MTLAEAIRAVFTNTAHDVPDSEDGDGQTTAEQVTSWLDAAVKHVRARLADDVPALYSDTSAEQTLTGGTSSSSLTLPDDFHKARRVERQHGTQWDPVEPSDDYAPDRGPLNWREEGGVIKVSPPREAAGTYRIVYVYAPENLSLANDGASLGLPSTLEWVAIERASAYVARRDKDSMAEYLSEADRLYGEQMPLLRRRHSQPQTAFRTVAPRSAYWRAR